MKKILVVDDELQILKAITRMLADTDYEVITSENGKDALAIIESTPVDMVIADMRMPIMDCFELLKVVKEKYPKIIRIILSGYAEEKAMFQAVLHNVAKLYIFKPWNNEEFLQSINKLFSVDTILHSDELIKSIDDMECSATIPDYCKQLLSTIEKEDVNAVIDELEQNADLSALLIQVAKSSIYGVMPNTVKQSVKYIGLHNMKCFVHWACVVNAMKCKETDAFDSHILLQHSYLTNRIFLFLYETFLHKQPPESALFAGLMHNIGLIMIAKNLQKKGSLSQDTQSEVYFEFDQKQYQGKHQEIGAHLLDQWDIPFPMYEVALYHHRPLDPYIVNFELVSCVYIAQSFAWKTLAGTEIESNISEVFDKLDLSKEEFETRLARYLK